MLKRMVKHAPRGEREILSTLRAANAGRRGGSGVRIGIGDDCAVLTPRGGEEIVVTTDFSIQGRHFRLDWHQPESIGHKCLARGLSDIAAMGARPLACFVSLALPQALAVSAKKKPSWMDRFYKGLLALASREGVTLAGGDLSESPTLAFADIVVIGAAPKGRALLRSTAHAGEILYVTGSLGGACAELAQLEIGSRHLRNLVVDDAAHPHFFPQPRIAVGQLLLRHRLATACIDISDGLSVDLFHLCEESNLGAELVASTIPLGAGAELAQALHGGDDYELLFTAKPGTRVPKRLDGVDVHAIGRMVAKKRGVSRLALMTLNGTQRTAFEPRGWEHF
jgi:thiamine-monophosphate kinase